MNVSRSSESPLAISEDIRSAADSHKSTLMASFSFGKVSPVTGWKAFFRGEFFGHGKMTNLTDASLLNGIASTHGETIANKVGRQLGLSSQSNKPINSYRVAKAVAMVEAEANWTKPLENTISYREVVDGKAATETTSYKSIITPLGRLKSLSNNLGIFGVSSTDINNKNAVNGWTETFSLEGTDKNNPPPTLQFVRSGMLMPPRPREEADAVASTGTMTPREQTAMNRYKQILSAMLETTPNWVSADVSAETYNENKPLPIEHAHIGLLSTNKEKESAMAQDQLDFIKNWVHDKPIQIDYCKPGTDQVTSIWVKPQVRYTNFSVQKAQQTELSQLIEGSPDAETEKTLDHYLQDNGAIEQKIAELYKDIDSAHSNDLKNTAEWKLLEDVRELRSTRNQEGSSFYSYEFQAKYSLLLNKCNIPTHVYCKSGKDRTSRFSEMTKMWFANPTLKLSKMTNAVRNVIKAFSFSGNSEIQRLNTGFAGNKQFKTYWRLIAGEKKDRTFDGWTHWLSAGSYSGWGASTIVKT